MNFLVPLGLLGLLGIPPILLLYFLKLRREERVVPSTLLWKKVIQDLQVNAPFQRLRYSLLLLLQLLLVALLAFALARPFLALSAKQQERLIFLIDTSASMATKDAGPSGHEARLDAAISMVKKKLEDLPPRAELSLISFDQETTPLVNFTSDRAQVIAALDKLEVRHLRTHPQDGFEVALAQSEEHDNAEVLVLSDGCFDKLSLQRLLGSEAAGNTEQISQQKLNRFNFVRFGDEETDNVGITSINADGMPVRGSDGTVAIEYMVNVKVENFSSKDQEVTLRVSSENGQFAPFFKALSLKGRQRDDASGAVSGALDASYSEEAFKLPQGTTGVITAALVSHEDNFALDDAAQVVITRNEGLKVLAVLSDDYFLVKALTVIRGVQLTQMAPQEFLDKWSASGPTAFESYDVICFSGTPPPTWERGGALFFDALPPIPEYLDKGEVVEFPKNPDWNVRHPVMRDVTFANVDIARAHVWGVPPTATKLVIAPGDKVLISSFENRDLRVVACSFKNNETNLPMRVAFPRLIENAVNWCAEASPRRHPLSLLTGMPLILPRAVESLDTTLRLPTGDVRPVKLEPDTRTRVSETLHVGLYTLDAAAPYGRTWAVNLCDAEESDNAAHGAVHIGDTVAIQSSTSSIQSRHEIWHWLAFAAMGILLLEWCVYHRRLGL